MPDITTSATHASDAAPKIDQFLYYAERSIKLGAQCAAIDGDIGIRTSLGDPDRSGSAQLVVARHARCRNLFSPSTSLEEYSEVRDVWTNALDRARDIGIGAEHKFPSGMPALLLANASGSGRDITLRRFEQNSLGPGTYGALTMLYESELWLAAGAYVFSSIEMDEHARLLALPGGVTVGVTGRLWTDSEARIVLHRDDAHAARFVISVAGSDQTGQDSDKSQAAMPRPAVVLGARAHLHALLAAPHGTARINFGARIKGAVAAFDIVAENEVHAEFQSGFPENPAGQQGSQPLTGYFNSPARPLVGPVPQETQISLAIGLPVRNPGSLSDQNAQVSDPKNANFRKFITQAEFKATYGATDADYASLKNWATDNGFTTVATYSNNLLLSVQATAAIIEQAFFVNLVFRQRTDGSSYVSVDRNPSLNLSVPILEISGLNDYYPVRNLNNPTATGNGGSFRAADLRNAYLGVGNPLQSLDGTLQVVGIVDFATFAASDISGPSGYASLQLPVQGQNSPLPLPNVTIVATEGGNPGANALSEADTDVAMVYAMAPAARILFFQGSTGITGHLDDILHAMATSATPLTIASCSLGFGYSDNANQALGQMAVNGVTFFTASGDNGDIGNNDPGNLKFVNQTLVGGTILNTNPLTSLAPNVYPNPYYSSENTWNTGGGATGGGILNGVPIPDYQTGVSMATNGGSTTNRNYPDVAAVASNIEFVLNGAPNSSFEGTSFAAPIWAGFMALVNQFGQNSGGPGKAGFINPTIYDIGLTSGTAEDLYKVCFNDIADNGGNGIGGGGGGHNSVAGYDLCTGWGSPQAGLINQLGSPAPLTPNQPLALIRFVITTGNDDAGGGLHGSSQTADCFVPGGGVFTLTLRNSSDPNWGNGSTHEVDFSIPATDNNGNPVPTLTQTTGLTGVRINLVQHNPDFSADNWDIANLQVSLFNPGSSQVCQLNLIGTSVLQDGSIGLVRLSKNADSSGNGPSSPTYPTGPGSGC
jgi:Pro-kumamolisin, activation domain